MWILALEQSAASRALAKNAKKLQIMLLSALTVVTMTAAIVLDSAVIGQYAYVNGILRKNDTDDTKNSAGAGSEAVASSHEITRNYTWTSLGQLCCKVQMASFPVHKIR